MKIAIAFSIGAFYALALGHSLLALPLSTRIKQTGFVGDSADAIAYVGTTFKLPILAEVVFNPQKQASIPQGELSAEEALRLLTKQTDEQWEAIGGAIHIYSSSVVKWKKNALGYYFTSITVPDKPSQFTYLFQSLLNAAAVQAFHPQAVYGFAASGIVPTELDGVSAHCIVGTFTAVNARQLLLREIVPAQLMLIVLFPEEKTIYSAATWDFVEQNIFWLSIDKPAQELAIRLPDE